MSAISQFNPNVLSQFVPKDSVELLPDQVKCMMDYIDLFEINNMKPEDSERIYTYISNDILNVCIKIKSNRMLSKGIKIYTSREVLDCFNSAQVETSKTFKACIIVGLILFFPLALIFAISCIFIGIFYKIFSKK